MRLYALELGRIDMDHRVIMPAGPPDIRIIVPVPGYLIQTGDATILVDSGMPRAILAGTEEIGPLMRPLGGEGAHVTAQLAALGFQPTDLTQIVATHFHFDHGGGLPEFPGVPIVAQRAAVEAARNGRPREQAVVNAPGLTWELVEGDVDLAPGVRLLLTEGHAIGHQSVLVETPHDGPFLLAIDAIYSRAQLAADDWGAYIDKDAARASARRVQEIAAATGATLVYGHDAAQWAELRHAPGWYGDRD
jgi:N-acyl homoserine lactone hydrolase